MLRNQSVSFRRKATLLIMVLLALLAPAFAEDAYFVIGDGPRTRTVKADMDFQLRIDSFSGGAGSSGSSGSSSTNLAIVIYKYERESSHDKPVVTRVEQVGGGLLNFRSGDLNVSEPGHYNLYLVNFATKWSDPPTSYLLKMNFEVKP